MTKEQIYELIKLLLKEDVFFSFDDTKDEYVIYDDVFDIKIYNKDLGKAVKKFILEIEDKYSNNFVKKLFKIASI